MSEWLDEPDRVEFEHAGLKCLILRQNEIGHLNGYVALPRGHPWYGRGYEDIKGLDVHGGLTFASEGDGDRWEKGWWWVGFDCAHSADLVPGLRCILGFGVYRNIGYVTAEVKRLAEQLAWEQLRRKLEVHSEGETYHREP